MSLVKNVITIVICFVLSGCTLHFKAKEIEVEGERQRVQNNTTYELRNADIL